MRRAWPMLRMLLMVLLTAVLAACCALAESGGWFVSRSEARPDVPEEALSLAASSGLPVLWIETDSGELPTEEAASARLIVLSAQAGSVQRKAARVEINIRGNTSKIYPKKSYKLKVVDDQGQKVNLSLGGLRSDDDWILNPMYTDTSKIREALSYALWDRMNSSGTAAASSRVAYAEVYLNGEYWGLYGVQERVDRKQVDSDKQTGVLYKMVANQRPGVEELLNCESESSCGGFQLEHAGEAVANPWLPAAAYMALLTGAEHPGTGALSLENTVDYGLWAMLTQAHDCHFKNQFVHAVLTPEGYVLYRMPWDLNNTLGDVYQKEAESSNYTEYQIGALVMDGAFEALIGQNDPAFREAVVRRWTELRQSVLTEEKLIEAAWALYLPLYDAITRDALRWPEGGMGDGNAANIRDIEGYFRAVLPRIDAYVNSLIP